MTSKQKVLGIMRSQGRADALDLRGRAANLDGTGIIAEEEKIPQFDPKKDYSTWAAGAPVWEAVEGERQVFKLITPHNAAHYPGSTPANTPALWSICHTKDPAKAKPFVYSQGTSGMWMTDECCTKDGHVWKSTKDGHSFPPNEVGTGGYWDDLGTIEEVQG